MENIQNAQITLQQRQQKKKKQTNEDSDSLPLLQQKQTELKMNMKNGKKRELHDCRTLVPKSEPAFFS